MTTSIPESHRDLLKADVGVLATNGPDGFPQVTATWFLLDDDGLIKISLNTARQKVKNLRANPNCTFFILDPASPYRTLEIRARAELTDDPDYAFADKVGRKYNADLRNMDRPTDRRVVVTLTPVKVNTWGS
ncbi:MAG: PPOX class F420-dependent oxidoreductase [Chloroflexota bacterium]